MSIRCMLIRSDVKINCLYYSYNCTVNVYNISHYIDLYEGTVIYKYTLMPGTTNRWKVLCCHMNFLFSKKTVVM